MSTDVATKELVELPIYFDAGEETLFGVLTLPDSDPGDEVVVVAPGGWYGTSTARNRSVVEISRSLARAGLPAFYFDYQGIGESTGTAQFDLHAPYTGDLQSGVAMLRSYGMRQFSLVGICYGTWVTLLAAPDIEGLKRVALVSMPPTLRGKRENARVEHAAEMSVTDLARRGLGRTGLRGLAQSPELRRVAMRAAGAKLRSLTSRKPPPSPDVERQGTPPQMLDAFTRLRDRDIPLLFLYSNGAPHFAQFREALDGPLGDILRPEASPDIDVIGVAQDVEDFARLTAQQALCAQLLDWLAHDQHPQL